MFTDMLQSIYMFIIIHEQSVHSPWGKGLEYLQPFPISLVRGSRSSNYVIVIF